MAEPQVTRESIKNAITELKQDPFGGMRLDQITPFTMVELTLTASQKMELVQNNYRAAMHVLADAEREYREAKYEAWANLPADLTKDKVSVKQKEAWVDAICAERRSVRDHAEAESKTWFEEVRNSRQVLSALQTAANMIKEDAGFARTSSQL